MRAVVTGGAGFIGSNLAEALLAEGHDVTIIDDLSTGFRENLPPEARFVEASITDRDAVDDALAGAQWVFHQAAARAVSRSVEDPVGCNEVNIDGMLLVLDAARRLGIERFVYASSSSIFGGVAPRPTPDDAPACPRSPYAVTKLTGEHYCRVFAELYGLETVALRYFNVYGPRQRPDSAYAAVIPLFIDALRSGAAPTVHGDGRQSRDFTFIDDVVAANLAAASAPPSVAGRAYNVAGGSEVSLLDLLAELGRILDVEVAAVHVDPRPGDVRHSCADPSGAADDLGWRAEVALADGLARTVRWFS